MTDTDGFLTHCDENANPARANSAVSTRITRRRLLTLSAACGLAFDAPKAAAQADFQVDANLVVLYVTVADRQGRAVQDLPKSTFQVTEDGAPQTITLFGHEDVPVAVGLVVDNSGSMRRKLPDVQAACAAFARSSNPQDQMFVVDFNEKVWLGLSARNAFVSDPDELKAALSEIHPIGETALYDAIAEGLSHIRQSPLQKKVLIVVSDGGDNASKHRFPDVLSTLEALDVVVYTVGLFDEYDTDRNPGVLRRLAAASGGQAFFPEEIPKVTNVLQTISRDIRHQYTIGYVPSNDKRDGTYRAVGVKLTTPHANRWTVRTRAGYIAAKSDSAHGDR